MTSRPSSLCWRTTLATAERTRAWKPGESKDTDVPEEEASLTFSISSRSSGRGRLPVCVVRMRSLLRFKRAASLEASTAVSVSFVRLNQVCGYRIRTRQADDSWAVPNVITHCARPAG